MTADSAKAPWAFESLYKAELPFIYSFLYRMGARSAEIEDLSHDVFVTAMRRFDSYDSKRPVRPWLLGIAHRLWADAKRKASSQREVLDGVDENFPFEGAGAEDNLAQRERKQLIEEALLSLEPERRATFVMYELEQLSAADIAEAMGTPLATTYSRLRIGREEFSEAVRRIQARRGVS